MPREVLRLRERVGEGSGPRVALKDTSGPVETLAAAALDVDAQLSLLKPSNYKARERKSQ